MSTCWGCAIIATRGRCLVLAHERVEAAERGDWHHFAALDAHMRGFLAQRFPVPCGCVKPLTLAWLDLQVAALACRAKEARS